VRESQERATGVTIEYDEHPISTGFFIMFLFITLVGGCSVIYCMRNCNADKENPFEKNADDESDMPVIEDDESGLDSEYNHSMGSD